MSRQCGAVEEIPSAFGVVGDCDEDHAEVQAGYSGLHGSQTWPASSVPMDAVPGV
ncbi:hypothetical protein [Streptosporangium minutum]|uniref:hypothetical protein n=1 Tax=Streptosporangium minutum TaxID=569862 RepID=UPI0013FDF527|nr:hypothetical protein [Streptosporangium minutum]